jgi:hypothetical protein
MKDMLKENDIPFVDRDINDYEEEYDLFVEATGNEFVPAFMLIEDPEESPRTRLLAPGRDFEDLEEGVEMIREFYER